MASEPLKTRRTVLPGETLDQVVARVHEDLSRGRMPFRVQVAVPAVADFDGAQLIVCSANSRVYTLVGGSLMYFTLTGA